ncbi:hypothetical protein [Rhizobium laguerreae]|uniref:Uncharacterized protein n=1 Tax=Rhizobium laguerreae TaxID=1076926 RepID=A0A6N9ZLH5_9HYPH|nr:hypothetical protein [Rhizobium laguerreae]NEH94303.1 hypothetical protein [Rhizobium laguerreae]
MFGFTSQDGRHRGDTAQVAQVAYREMAFRKTDLAVDTILSDRTPDLATAMVLEYLSAATFTA